MIFNYFEINLFWNKKNEKDLKLKFICFLYEKKLVEIIYKLNFNNSNSKKILKVDT